MIWALPMLAAAGLCFVNRYLKLPRYERCPAARRKHQRKARAEARRILRDPINRGNRAVRRRAHYLLRISKSANPRHPTSYIPEPLTPEEKARFEAFGQLSLTEYVFEKTNELIQPSEFDLEEEAITDFKKNEARDDAKFKRSERLAK